VRVRRGCACIGQGGGGFATGLRFWGGGFLKGGRDEGVGCAVWGRGWGGNSICGGGG